MKNRVLTAEQRLTVAQVSGIGQRHAYGRQADLPWTEALTELWSVTRNPIVYGVALAAALANVELDGRAQAQRLAELYRAAGADEHLADDELQWHRHRPEYRLRSTDGPAAT